MRGRYKIVTDEKQEAIRGNIFPAAWPAIEDWASFPWHTNRWSRQVDADQVSSSQALAIDVFGTIKCSSALTIVMDALATRLGVPTGGPWDIHLEWNDPDNLLDEIGTLTQVDAAAFGANTVVLFESKFTEPDGGPCGQPKPRPSGGAQCNGRYKLQRNPLSGVVGRCSLSGKGIRYWDVIPSVFRYDKSSDYDECPFKGPAYQWMRNMVLAHELARYRAAKPAFVVAYAEGEGLAMSERIGSAAWRGFTDTIRAGVMPFAAMSHQAILEVAQAASPDPRWVELKAWVADKIARVRSAGDVRSTVGD